VILIYVILRDISSTSTTRLTFVSRKWLNVIFHSSSLLREYRMEGKYAEGRRITTIFYAKHIATYNGAKYLLMASAEF